MRARDVELLTGLQFFPSVSDLSRQLLLRTHLEVGLWDRISWLDLDEEAEVDEAECPLGWVLSQQYKLYFATFF